MRTIEDLPGPRRLPGVGNSLQMRPSEAHLIAEGWCARYGPVFRFDLGPHPVVGVGALDDINAILRNRPGGFSRWAEVEPIFRELGVAGVFSAEGEAWRQQRRLAVTALNTNHLHRYFSVIQRAAERLNQRLSVDVASTRLDLLPSLKAFTTEVISALAFGQDLGAGRQGGELRADIDRLFGMMGRRFVMPFPYWRHFKLPADRALERSLERLQAVVAQFIAAARERMRVRPELRHEPENFLEGMLAAQELDGRFSEQELFGNTLTMLIAGEDTTSATLGWTAWLLSTHPDVQDRVADEARGLMGSAIVPTDHEMVGRFAYGEAVIREAMRLRPAAPMQTAQALQDTLIADVHVPAGTKVALFTRCAANREEVFPDPHRFLPERWLDGGRDTAQQHKGFLTFGAGPRFCPGRNLALLEAKTALATLVRSYRINRDPAGRPVKEKFTFTVVPDAVNVAVRDLSRRPAPIVTSSTSPDVPHGL